ncbi:hypothetical protein BFF78_41775 [Streptomyces fodineus]|uniref:Uncharacterized protein n=1 Tax=Streptomyces fodineus TaxID=1904616 RepID=A0A1D7YMV3_9ACTN|nr:hypothetical protein BFF78_41775 [Streptomyces fodineus]
MRTSSAPPKASSVPCASRSSAAIADNGRCSCATARAATTASASGKPPVKATISRAATGLGACPVRTDPCREQRQRLLVLRRLQHQQPGADAREQRRERPSAGDDDQTRARTGSRSRT